MVFVGLPNCKSPSGFVIGADLAQTPGRLLFLVLMILLTMPMGAFGNSQASIVEIFNDVMETSDGTTAKKLFEKQAFPWYDSKKREFIPVREDKPPEDFSGKLPASGSWFQLSPGPIFFWVLFGVIMIWVIVFLIRFDWAGLKRDRSTDTETKVEIETEKLAALPQSVRGTGDLLGRAGEHAERGEFGEAITFYHSWQLLRLDKTGHIELQSGKTNRAYLGELSGAPKDLREIFLRSTRLFEDAFYGGLTIDGGAFHSVWNDRSRFDSPLVSARGPR